jgi:Spy/CpxP family protein refolding chaperone
MFKEKPFLFFILSVLVLSTSCSQAQEKKVFKFKKGEPNKWEMKDDLNLSETQKKQFDDLDFQFDKKMIDLRADLEKSKLAKRELIKKGNFNRNDYLAAEEKILQAENKIEMEKAKLKMDKYTLLDDNQKEIFIREGKHEFMFKFDLDDFQDRMKIFKDKMEIFKEKMQNWKPCIPDIDEIEKEIELNIEGEEI